MIPMYPTLNKAIFKDWSLHEYAIPKEANHKQIVSPKNAKAAFTFDLLFLK